MRQLHIWKVPRLLIAIDADLAGQLIAGRFTVAKPVGSINLAYNGERTFNADIQQKKKFLELRELRI